MRGPNLRVQYKKQNVRLARKTHERIPPEQMEKMKQLRRSKDKQEKNTGW